MARSHRLREVPRDWTRDVVGLAKADIEAARVRGEPRFESMAINEILKAEPFEVIGREAHDSRAHINILEVRAAVKQIRAQARRRPRVKQLYLLDSRVAIGALAKTRSASPRQV